MPLPPPPLLLVGARPGAEALPLLLVPRAQRLAAKGEVVVVDGYGLDPLPAGGARGLAGGGGGGVEVVLVR